MGSVLGPSLKAGAQIYKYQPSMYHCNVYESGFAAYQTAEF